MIRFIYLLSTLSICLFLACSDVHPTDSTIQKAGQQYVFQTDSLERYQFPTHINDLIVDRANSTTSEVFMVIVEPGKSVHHHQHADTEQIFYILEGTGVLSIGSEKRQFYVNPGDVVRIPVATLHSIRTNSDKQIKYLCVDCFTKTPDEPSWDEHVKVVCQNKKWDYSKVKNGTYE